MFDTGQRVTHEPATAKQPANDGRKRPRDVRRAVLGVVQAKLSVGSISDPFEREADQVADRVMQIIQRRAPDATPAVDVDAHRCGPACLHRHPDHATAGDGVTELITRIQRSPSRSGHRCGPGCLQRHAGHGDDHDHAEIGHDGGDLSDDLTSMVQRSAGRGTPLGEGVRGRMEAAFGSDFSDVRVHTDSDIAPRIAAEAFTMGSDIHFAPGAYRPADRSGQWLLGHELTHVVQQQGPSALAGDGFDVHRNAGGCIHRHASKEHYMLGSMTPQQIRAIADAKENVEVTARSGVGSSFKNLLHGDRRPPAGALAEALQSVKEQLTGLDNWRTVTGPGDPDPVTVKKGSTDYNHHWGGQLVTVTCADGELVCTVGELNALPDFFGSMDDLRQVDRSVAFKTFQVIRRETYVYLKSLEAQLEGRSYSYSKKTEGFTGIEKNNVSLASGALPKFGNDAADVIQTEAMLKGEGAELGLDEAIGAGATLGRNACHFPPESWLRWRDHHSRARALINSAADLADLEQKANEAIGLNAFGEHYLQDSFAGGHLINKGFVMAVAAEHASVVTKKWRGMSDAKIAELQGATKHKDAYKLPTAAKEKLDDRKAGVPVRQNVLDDPTMKARDPQTALETAKRDGTSAANAKQVEMSASGIDPASMTFEQYRTWLNDFWFQKITNTLHDKYCINGLEVASPDNPVIFKIYGDNNMMRSGEGAEYTAQTSLMSRRAINNLVQNKRNQLTPLVPGGKPRIPAKPVTTMEAIIARFPNIVKDDNGAVMSLKTWATGEPMRKKIANMVALLSKEGWTEGKLTRVVKLASPLKNVAAGLGADHGPF